MASSSSMANRQNISCNKTQKTSLTKSQNWENLEINILKKIFSALSISDLINNVSSVCNSWLLACWDFLFWGTQNSLDLSDIMHALGCLNHSQTDDYEEPLSSSFWPGFLSEKSCTRCQHHCEIGFLNHSRTDDCKVPSSSPLSPYFVPEKSCDQCKHCLISNRYIPYRERIWDPTNFRLRKLLKTIFMDGNSAYGVSLQQWRLSLREIFIPPGLIVSDDHLLFIAQRTPNLESLNLFGSRITGKGFAKALRGWKNLKHINMGQLRSATTRVLDEIFKNCPNIVDFHINFSENEQNFPSKQKNFPSKPRPKVKFLHFTGSYSVVYDVTDDHFAPYKPVYRDAYHGDNDDSDDDKPKVLFFMDESESDDEFW